MIDYIVGDTREAVANIPTGTVSLVACSPPFIALRSYLPADHPDKDKEIGSEPDPATFLDTLLGLTAEWGRVLAPWGSIAIELGDTYASSGPGGENNLYTSGYSGGRTCETQKPPGAAGVRSGNWPRAKCLALVPQLYAASLAYGRNLLRTGVTGDEMVRTARILADGLPGLTAAELIDMLESWLPQRQRIARAEFEPWLVRNVIVWHRPNPAVGALGDKYRPSTSYITVATRSAKRWFDLTAVRTEHRYLSSQVQDGKRATNTNGNRADDGSTFYNIGNPAGAPPLDTWFDEHDTWTLTTQPSQLAHYAMWPAKLAERLILSMCPAQVCNVCGEPRRRIEESTPSVDGIVGKIVGFSNGLNATHGNYEQVGGTFATRKNTLGWSDCGHDDYRPGVVLDPFCGTGTSLCVAELHGRDSIGVDIDSRNRELLDRRMAEVKRNLFGTAPEMPGQESLFAS